MESTMRRIIFIALLATVVPAPGIYASGDWIFGIYADAAYLKSDNEPDNRTWRSKSTTFKLDSIEANLVRGFARKQATPASRWGLELGAWAGVDADGLTTSAPPPSYEPVEHADKLKYLSTTTVSYLFPAGNGLLVTGGLLSAYIAYESFYSLDNPNYTRGYLTDNVPYNLWGVQASYPFHDEFTADFILSTGYNYLTNPTNAPSYGVQLTWQPAGPLTFTQNLYYGPDQSDTALEYWRLLSDTVVEWQGGWYLLAASYDYGSERQSWLAGTPRFEWMSGALWARVDIGGSWRAAVRPEFYWDPDGLMTGARQTLRAITATVEFHGGYFTHDSLSARLEYRYDRSTGDEGGFYAGDDNHLVPEQNLLILSFTFMFGGHSPE
jgi:hypothetical protein